MYGFLLSQSKNAVQTVQEISDVHGNDATNETLQR